MKPKFLNALVAAAGLLVPVTLAHAQSAYYQAVTTLGPAGYWPMHEIEPNPHGDIETNYGTLGTLATGFYGDWETLNNTPVVHGQPGCIVNDSSETAVHFTQTSTSPSTGGFTNGLVVPHTSPLATLNPPFSVECWMNGDGSGNKQADIWGQAGASGLNGGPNYAGIRLHWGNVGWVVYSYNGVSGSDLLTLISYNSGVAANTWYHTVLTDDGTNITLWINGAPVGSAAQAGNYAPDSWTPLAIDNGVGGGAAFKDSMKGYIDEFAVYTNALPAGVITNHYTLGETGTASAYYSAVNTANPVIYYLMNSPAISTESVGAALSNDGSAGINGVYRPEVLPGSATGPGALGAGFGATNAMPGNGCNGFADVGNSASYNPTGSGASFSVTAWFQGNPTDSRIQSIVGHGTNSWQLGLASSGKVVFNSGTNSAATVGTGLAAGDLVSPGVYNDGFWHQAVATHNGTVNVLYLDGVPVATNTSSVSIPGSGADVLIGADPSFTNNPTQGEGRQFAGNICEVAFFASTLTASQIQTLYNASDVEPVITQQPISATINAGSAFTNSITAIGVGPLSYQWYTNGQAFGSATTNSLVINPVQPVNAGSYYVVVSNNYGSATSAVVNLTVQSAPILVGQFPVTYTNILNTNFMTLYAGVTPTFSISSVGEQPIYYFWFTNGVADGAATNASLTLTNVQIGTFSDYCILSNTLGTATSAVWSATVVSDPTNLAGAPAPYPQVVLSLNPIAYWRLNEGDNGAGNNGAIAFDYAGGNDGIYTNVILDQSGYNPVSDPSDTSVEVGENPDTTNSYVSMIGTNIDFSVPAGKNAEFSVECWAKVSANGGGIVAKGFGNGGEEMVLDTGGAKNAFRFYLRPNGQNVIYTATGTAAPNGSWAHLAAVCDEANSNLSLYVNGALAGQTNIPPKSGIVNDIPMNLTIGARSNSSGSGDNLQSVGTINDVAVFNYALTPAQVANQYNQSGISPYFTQQPALTYVGQGSNAIVTAVAAGTSPLAYQWYETNLTAMTGHAVAGQTNVSLVVSNIPSSDNYFLSVVNPYGSSNSVIAPVVVYSSPIIIGSLPVTYTNVGNVNIMTLYAGANPKFSVSALGLGALSYQWFTNGAPVGGATGTNLTVAATGAGMLTNACIVGNLQGTATNTWIASVLADPTNVAGGLAVFPQTVLALRPSGYWRLNEGPDDGNGDQGLICHDYAGGNDGIYTNADIGQSGYNPTEDPSDTSAQFDFFATANCDANSILAPDVSVPNGLNAEFTVEAWVNPTLTENLGTAVGIAAKGYFSQEEFTLDCGAPGNAFRFEVHDAGGTTYNANSTLATTNTGNWNQWYHLVGVCDEAGGLVMVYTNGQLAGSTAIPGASGLINSSSTPMTIGARASSATSGNNNQFAGFINDVAVFNYALSPGQVAAEYAAVTPTAPFLIATPPTNSGVAVGANLVIPAMAGGTPPLTYVWTNLTTSTTLAAGTVPSAAVVHPTLTINNVPAALNGNQLELIINNSYGATNAFVTLSVTNAVNSNPTNIVFTATNNELSLSWPADHKGWQLQAQTNSLSVGLSTNWVNVAGSTGTNQVVIPFNLTNGTVFYRLAYP